MHTGILTRPSATLAFDSVGEGAAILLLHAGGERRRVWHPVMSSLATHGFHSTAYDQRGHGDSTGAREHIYDFGHDATAMIANLTVPIVVGASLGGFAAMLALADPKIEAACAGLVLVDVGPAPDPVATRAYLATVGMSEMPLINDILSHRGTFTAIIKRLQLPILVVRAGDETRLRLSDIHDFLALAPHASVVEIPGASHLVARDKPDELAIHIAQFGDLLTVQERRS